MFIVPIWPFIVACGINVDFLDQNAINWQDINIYNSRIYGLLSRKSALLMIN